jgi:hypothetical protein
MPDFTEIFQPAGAPVKIILDSDIGSDCDDVGALAVLHALASRGEAEILATMACNSATYGAPCLDVLNTYFGRAHVPVGCWKGNLPEPSRYHRALVERCPSRLRDARDAPDAVELYAEILAAQPDGSVVIATIGTLNNLAQLLEIYPWLVEQKVRFVSVMGGVFPYSPRKEANFSKPVSIIPATQFFLEHWPPPLLLCGAEIGDTILTGRRLFSDAPADSPVRAAYQLYFDGVPTHRPSWDQAAVLAAVRGPAAYWRLRSDGRCQCYADGINAWLTDTVSQHAYLLEKTPPAQMAELIEGLMLETGNYTDP